MARLPVCVLVLACAGGTAAGQHARYPRQQPPPPTPVLSERVKPLVAKPADVATTKPSIDVDAVLSIEGLHGPVRAEQEPILADLITNTPDSETEEKSDYYFRLGELYAKQHRFWRIEHAELAARTSSADRQQAAQAANHAKLYLLKTVKTFKALTDNDAFRNYAKLDVALFYYAYTLQGGKYLKEARAVYDKLVKNYPSSKYVPEAHLAFAEYYYDANQLADAETRYKHVLKFPKSSVYAYALYKLGWIHLQLSRAQEAVEAFSQTVAATRGDPKRARLYHAAKADFVRAYAGLGTTDRAYDVFQKLDRTAALDLVELLAEVARDGGAAQRAATAYRELLTRTHGDARACRWQYRLAHATLSIPGATSVAKIKEVEALMRVYSSQNPPDDECRANAAAMSGELAIAYYAEWAKTRNAETLGYAEQLFALHVAAFPDAATHRAAYAEVLWARADHEPNAKLRRARWQRSAEAFATDDTPEAARAAALAWMNALDVVVPGATKVSLGKAPRARPRALPLATLDAKLVTAVTAYTRHASSADDELAQMRLAAAIILRRYRHFDEAATVLDEFLEHHQAHPRAELAANLMLDSMIQARKLDEVREVAAAIAADRSFVDGKPELQRNLQWLRVRLLR